MAYVGWRKTAVASVLLGVVLVSIWYYYHILWTLWMLAVLWYWQMWFGYDKAEAFNTDLLVATEASRDRRR